MDKTKKPKCYQPEPTGFCRYYTHTNKNNLFEGGEPVDQCKKCKWCEFSNENTDEI